jgi:hypothetical protein
MKTEIIHGTVFEKMKKCWQVSGLMMTMLMKEGSTAVVLFEKSIKAIKEYGF